MGILIENNQIWEDTKRTEYTYTIKNEVIYSFGLETSNKIEDIDNFLYSVYVQPKYRGKGYFYKLMNKVFELTKGNIYIHCNKNSSIINKYLELGFEFFNELDENYDYYVFTKTS